MKNKVLLYVEDLTIGFQRKNTTTTVVKEVSYELNKGEILGIVGESGSGKTITALAMMGLLPQQAKILKGAIYFEGNDIGKVSVGNQRAMRGSQMAMVFQEPMTSLNPVLTIGQQLDEMLRLHTKLPKSQYKSLTIKALKEAGLEQGEIIYHQYPHQLSGGMRQRAMIAMAMMAGPKVLIADEPTTALDVSVQEKILKLLKEINEAHGTAIILVSHDLGVIKSICHRAIVMKNGEIIEAGNVEELFKQPKEEYTKQLLKAAPMNWEDNKSKVNNVIKEEIILDVDHLNVFYRQRGKGLFSGKEHKQVVKEVSFLVYKGESLGIVGESGCGKSTLAKAIAGLNKDITGKIGFITDGTQTKPKLGPQMVFQDPYGSLNPSKKISWILEEPLKINNQYTKKERVVRIKAVMQQVGLEENLLHRYVSQLSGGQRQRVAIAVAFILRPELIILDEPVSALDVTIQAQIIELLQKLQKEYQVTYLFISHDLNVVYQMCHRVCVMYQGEVVEMSNTKELFHRPKHEYSKMLLEASLGVKLNEQNM